MPIAIQKQPAALSFNAPMVTFELEDRGSAHVSFTLSIPGVTAAPLHHDEPYSGSRSITISIPPGKYIFDLLIAAYDTANALGPTYDASLKINGVLAATAIGSIPAKKHSAFGFSSIPFKVI